VKILYDGFGQPYVIRRLLSLLDNGLKIDGVVINASLLHQYKVKKFTDIAKLKEYDITVWLDTKPPKNMGYEKWQEYLEWLFNELKGKDIIDVTIEYLPEDELSDLMRDWILDNAPSPVAVMYEKQTDIDVALTNSGILAIQPDEYIDIRTVSRIAKERGINEVVWYGYSRAQSFTTDIHNKNVDTFIVTFWNGVMRSGITLFNKLGKLDYINVREANKTEWEKFVRQWEQPIETLGLNINSIIDTKKITWDKAFFNIIVFETYRNNSHTIPKRVKVSAFGCHNCIMSDKCPAYNPDLTYCPLLEEQIKGIKLNDMDDLIDGLLLTLINEKFKRYLRSRIFEDLDGGSLDKHTSRLEDSLTKLVETYLKLKYPERFRGIIGEEDDEVNKELEELLSKLGGG